MSTPEPLRRELLPTEQRNPRTLDLDRLRLADAVARLQAEDATIHTALAAARGDIVRAVELVVRRLARGGRMFYCGAGTSGRLGVLDAVECPPTFQTDPELVQGVLAGGTPALLASIEGAEDDPLLAWRALEERGMRRGDVVVAIAASGTTPFAHGAIDCAQAHEAASIFLACVPRELAPDRADVSIRVLTGPEVLTGSTRMKAATATKLVLNTLSTLAMVRLGKVHENLMVDLHTRGNAKLRDRGARIVATLTGLDVGRAAALLESAGGQVKLAVLMHHHRTTADDAAQRLHAAGGYLRAALETGTSTGFHGAEP